MKTAQLRPRAEADLVEAARYYAQEGGLALGERMFDAAIAALEPIERMPSMGSPRPRTLPPGAEIVFAPFVAQTGTYLRGGSWIFRGEVTVGRHATWADALSVTSDRPHIVFVERVDAPDSPDMHHVRLVTRERGEARIVLRVQSLDESGRPTRDPPVEDSIIIEVQP